MSESYRIYLDACCLNRPFDDQTQSRIALETQAILTILSQCQLGQWKLITSTVLDAELAQMPNLERLNNVKALLAIALIKVVSSSLIEERTVELVQLGVAACKQEGSCSQTEQFAAHIKCKYKWLYAQIILQISPHYCKLLTNKI